MRLLPLSERTTLPQPSDLVTEGFFLVFTAVRYVEERSHHEQKALRFLVRDLLVKNGAVPLLEVVEFLLWKPDVPEGHRAWGWMGHCVVEIDG